MWPCGMLPELFTAESKMQVYAALHQLLFDHNISALSECDMSLYSSYVYLIPKNLYAMMMDVT